MTAVVVVRPVILPFISREPKLWLWLLVKTMSGRYIGKRASQAGACRTRSSQADAVGAATVCGCLGMSLGTGKAATHAEALLRQRERLVAELEALRNKISGLDLAIQLITQVDRPAAVPTERMERSDRGAGITTTIQRLLVAAGDTGINAEEAVEIAAREGIALNRSSVSSLLSRMKRAGDIAYVDKKYVLAKPPR